MAQQFTLKNGGYEPFIGNYGLVPQPPITTPESTDNGKVLGVSEGQYALVSGGGGGGSSGLVVHVQYENDAAVLDKTWAEIWSAYSSGSQVVLIDDVREGEALCQSVTSMGEADLIVETSDGSGFYADTADDYPRTFD